MDTAAGLTPGGARVSAARADAVNAAFWDDLCGSGLAREHGVTDASPASLARFDAAYLAFYPYLLRHLDPDALRGQRVLEVGLGYGTVSELLAASAGAYVGLDVAANPVAMVNHRLRSKALAGSAVQGSILASPFADRSFDCVVAIGCFHHTGDTRAAIREAERLLVSGGRLVLMVYNALSYRRWLTAPLVTLRAALRGGGTDSAGTAGSGGRRAYDMNSRGDAAPITAWHTVGELEDWCSGFGAFSATLENVAASGLLRSVARETLLNSPLARRAGLDVYVSAVK